MATMLKGSKKATTIKSAKLAKAAAAQEKALVKTSKRTAKTAMEHLGPDDDKSDLAIADRVGVTITAPNFKTVEIVIRGTAPYVQLAFGKKAREMMREKQAAGSTAAKGRKLSNRERAELEALPARLEALEKEQSELTTRMADPAFFKGGGPEVARAAARLPEVEAEIAAAYARWTDLEG
jgi:hypothetical protein